MCMLCGGTRARLERRLCLCVYVHTQALWPAAACAGLCGGAQGQRDAAVGAPN
jgi:hypothetical protein